MTYKKISLGALALVAIVSFAGRSEAALVPTYLISPVNSNTQTQITILNADPNAAATLHYPTGGATSQLSIGNTNGTGYLTYTVTPTTYNITIGGQSYVRVNGSQSQNQVWPSYSAAQANTGSGSLVLSQSSITVYTNQNTSVMVAGDSSTVGTVSIPTNTNLSVATVSVSGMQVNISALSAGSTNVTICGSNVGCSTLYVTVQQQGSDTTTINNNSSTISFSQSAINVGIGQSQVVTLYGPGSYYISSNTNTGVASASIGGSNLTINGIAAGTASFNVCASSANNTSCGTVTATVTSAASTGTTATQTIALSESEVSLSIGQAKTVTITNPVSNVVYYISSNSNTGAVTANMNGNTSVDLRAIVVGGSNIMICKLGQTDTNACSNLYVYVAPGTSGTGTAVPTTSSKPPVLSSFLISSNNVNNTFMGTGAALSFTFSLSQNITAKNLTVNGMALQVYGNGSGPYTGIYTLLGNEPSVLPIALSFSNSAGLNGQASFTIGSSGVTAVPVAAGSGSPSASAGQFTEYLYVGSLSAQVTLLQQRLTALGVYSGPITGKYGGQTEAAVKKYQAKHGLTQIGVVGPATRDLLNKGI